MKKILIVLSLCVALVATLPVNTMAFEAELFSTESTIVTYEVVNENIMGGGDNNENEDGTGGLVVPDEFDKDPNNDENNNDNNVNNEQTNDEGNTGGDGGDTNNVNNENDNGENGYSNNAGDADNAGNNNEDNSTPPPTRGVITEPQEITEPEIAYGKFILSVPATITVGETGWVTADMRFPAERVFTVSVAGFESDGTIRLYNTDGTGEFISVYLLNEGGAQYSNSYNMIGQWFYYDRGLCINFTPVLASDTTKVSNGTYSGTIQFNVSTYVMG